MFTSNLSFIYSYPQPNTYLYLLEFESGSSFINMLNILSILFYTFLLHLIVLLCSCAWEWKEINKKLKKISEFLTFGYYIQFTLEIYLLLLFGSLSEIYYWRKDPKFVKFYSEISAFIIISFWVFIIFYSLWYSIWLKQKEEKRNKLRNIKIKRKKCEQWISGTKKSRLARLFTPLFLTRRLLFWTLVFLFVELNLYTKLWIFASIQWSYMILFALIRPFEEKKELLTEWINDFFYLAMIIILFFYNKLEDWTSLITDIYIYLIIGNNVLTLLVTICKTLYFITFSINIPCMSKENYKEEKL